MMQTPSPEAPRSLGAALKPFRSRGAAKRSFENLSQACRHTEAVVDKAVDDRKDAAVLTKRLRREIQNLEWLLPKQDAEVQRIKELETSMQTIWSSRLESDEDKECKLGVGSYVRIVAKGQDHDRLGIVEEDHRASSTLLLVKLYDALDRKAWFADRDVVFLPSVSEWRQHVLKLVETAFNAKEATLDELLCLKKQLEECNHELSKHEKLILPTRVAQKEASRKMREASAFTRKAILATRVRLCPAVGKPKTWRDLGAHVSCEWAVKVGDGKNISVVSGADAVDLSKAVLFAGLTNACHEDVLLARPRSSNTDNASTDEFAISLEQNEARRIFDSLKAGASPPGPLRSMSIMKACLGGIDDVVVDADVRDFFENVESGVIRTKMVSPPAELRSTLRPYQLRGFQWLVSNASNGFGCILADDMGLGKTLQMIAFILHQKRQGAMKHPALIVSPKGLLGNWERELKAWAPMLTVYTHYGIQRTSSLANLRGCSSHTVDLTWRSQHDGVCQTPARKGSGVESFEDDFATPSKLEKTFPSEANPLGNNTETSLGVDIILTSYGIVRRDANELVRKQKFSCMVLDEAQLIKNYSSQTSISVKRVAEVAGPMRIALSGTPVENRLSDLHSLFEFILPGYLASSRAEFDRTFARPVAANVAASKCGITETHCRGNASGGGRQQEMLRMLIQPFVLRRLKTDPTVAPDLPSKIEMDHLCPLSDKQAALYNALQRSTLKSITDNAISPFMRQRHILGMIHAFREVCNHPATLKSERRPPGFEVANSRHTDVQASGKCVELHRLLDEIVTAEEKVVIFCQYLETIDMLAAQISSRQGCRILKYTGASSLEEREKIVQTFQSKPEIQVLLLSLQAGGVGLTLTAASHVIHFDRCYNPAKENQATDRVHRIGQTKTVCVHRLAAKDTFEERLAEIMSKKQALSDVTLQANENWVADMDDDELRNLFSLADSCSWEADCDAPLQKKRRI